MSLIFQARGTPTPQNWPGVDSLPNYIQYQNRDAPNMYELFRNVVKAEDANAIDLLSKLLQLNPVNRITADEVIHF